ncbi:MAG: hypothetical protein ABEI06_05930 [Halobacteriaceae archaeon]
MPSLGEAYENHKGVVSRRKIILGTALFIVGVLLVSLGIIAAGTPILVSEGFSVFAARELAGIVAGIGVPAVFVGIFIVLPANKFQRGAAAIGASITILGILLFRFAYPERWFGTTGIPTTLALGTLVIYSFGLIVTFWCLFTAIATFKRRNDPGGTVTLTFKKGGETKTVEVVKEDVDKARKAFGGVGVFGNLTDTDADTQTGTPTSDGGEEATIITDTNDSATPNQQSNSAVQDETGDKYCGNCAKFKYVRTDEGIQPYCGHFDELMDDMEPCQHWEAYQGE